MNAGLILGGFQGHGCEISLDKRRIGMLMVNRLQLLDLLVIARLQLELAVALAPLACCQLISVVLENGCGLWSFCRPFVLSAAWCSAIATRIHTLVSR